MTTNPFKFGSIVDGIFFTDRVTERAEMRGILDSANHLVLISPRRFGKTSLVKKVTDESKRPTLYINLQSANSGTDIAERLLRALLTCFTIERVKHLLMSIRIMPTISVNALTGAVGVKFQPLTDPTPVLEDVLNTIERIGEQHPDKRPIVVFDEFQEVTGLGEGLDRKLRSTMQLHKHVNYVFLGSQEAMMENIFLNKKSPFYHFGLVMRLPKIPHDDFARFIINGMSTLNSNRAEELADDILRITGCHPYYTQQLAFMVWEEMNRDGYSEGIVDRAVDALMYSHSLDYERLWDTFNRTDRRILTLLANQQVAVGEGLQYTQTGITAQSTAASAIKRLCASGYIIRGTHYEVDDPFFRRWIQELTK